MLKFIDRFLDKLTMYRLLLYYLILLLAVAIGLSELGYLHYKPASIAFSAVYLTIICWVSNKIFAKVYDAPTNVESVYITALILALIITPVSTTYGILFLTAAGGLAMASKYMLAIGRRHLFNPAAIAVVLTSYGGGQSASWWVGTSILLPFVLLGGILILRKIQRWSMALSFLAVTTVTTALYGFTDKQNVATSLYRLAFSSALFFLASVMLTEPLTSPSMRKMQIWYGVLVGILFSPPFHIGSFYATPEIALVVGNVFSYFVNPRVKIFPVLTKRITVTPNTKDFIFTPERKISYRPGQYMEWTIPHSNTDSRGNRRYFTLASSPTEPNIRIGVKFSPKGSSFKKAMSAMSATSQVVATDLGGDFVLPKDSKQKIAFIAGGIGVTPYRSMLKYLVDTKTPQPVTLLYSAKTIRDFAYTDVFDDAKRVLGTKVIYTITGKDIPANWPGKKGQVTANMIKAGIPDYQERIFYISGSNAMVAAIVNTLRNIGVHHTHIKTDLFSGYA